MLIKCIYYFCSVDQLRRQCRTSELRQIFAKYLVSSSSVNGCLSNRAYFLKSIKYIIRQSNVDSAERLRDALKAAELYSNMSRIDVLVCFAYQLIVHDSTIDDVSDHHLHVYNVLFLVIIVNCIYGYVRIERTTVSCTQIGTENSSSYR